MKITLLLIVLVYVDDITLLRLVRCRPLAAIIHFKCTWIHLYQAPIAVAFARICSATVLFVSLKQ